MKKCAITFIGFLFALFGAGVELSKLAIGFGALGIGVGFGGKKDFDHCVYHAVAVGEAQAAARPNQSSCR